jgi:lipoprotein-anchoring transpeptidase ErfK/SrfK
VAATTNARLPQAPLDPAPQDSTDGDVVRPLGTLTVRDAPAGRAFAKVPPRQFGDTWLPVIDRRDGWVRVLLPARPNGATGWLPEARVETRRSPYEVVVHLGSRTLELFYEGDQVGSWTVAVGKPGTPTPTGRTFVLGSVVDESQSYSPVILPLGSHSDTLDTYGGGPGTVALHGWPDASVFGSAVSHGCIRVPAEALDRLRQVPLGTLVRVDEQ